jgi:hypothetical protein
MDMQTQIIKISPGLRTTWVKYCGIARDGAQSTMYVDHLGIELQNVEIMPIQCHQSDIQAIIQKIKEHGFIIADTVVNPWTSIVPYIINVLLRLGYNIEFDIEFGG